MRSRLFKTTGRRMDLMTTPTSRARRNAGILSFLLILALAGVALAQQESYYVASRLRAPFHRPSCRWAAKITPNHLQTFRTREEAVAAGHRPCLVCLP